MQAPRVRFSVRRMMGVVALTGIVLGLAVEIPRVWRRWRFCQERADLFAERAASNRRSWQQAIAHLERTEAVIRTLNDLGPERRSISSLTRLPGDPDGSRLWFKRLVRYVKETEGTPELQHEWGEHMISPVGVVEWYAGLPERQRNEARRRAGWTEDSVRMARAYQRAGARPWEPLPHETIKP